MDMKGRHANAICVICGKGYYKRPSRHNTNCCSTECNKEFSYRNGKFSIIPYCKDKGITVDDFVNNSDHYIWEVIQTIETLKVA